MAAALIVLFTGCLLPGALCGSFKVILPQTIRFLRGSCVTIPCSFDIEDKYKLNLDHTCAAIWLDGNTRVFDSKTTAIEDGQLTGNLTKKDCTTTLSKTETGNKKYLFRLECQNSLKYTFGETLSISDEADPPSPTLSPPTLEVREGSSVTLKCSAPAPCVSLPPRITWSPRLGDAQEIMEDAKDKTKVKTSVLNLNVSHLHHKKEISCTATYSKQNGSTASAASTSLTALVSFPPQILHSFTNCTRTAAEVSCSCETVGNPIPTVFWYLDGTPVNHSSTFAISTEPLSDTGLKSVITVSQSHMKLHSTLVCNSSNAVGAISHLVYNTHKQQTSTDQDQATMMVVIPTLVGLLLCALSVIIGIRGLCSPSKSTGDSSSTTTSRSQSRTEGNDLINTEEERIYANVNQLRQEDKSHPTSGGASERLEKNEDGNEVIYSTVTVTSKHNKRQQGNSMDRPLASSSYTLDMPPSFMQVYEEIETRKVENVECEYSQVKFKDNCSLHS